MELLIVTASDIGRGPIGVAVATCIGGDALARTLSAGVSAIPHDAPHWMAIAAAAELSVSVSAHRATRLTQDVLDTADRVLVVDALQRDHVVRRFETSVPVSTVGEVAGALAQRAVSLPPWPTFERFVVACRAMAAAVAAVSRGVATGGR